MNMNQINQIARQFALNLGYHLWDDVPTKEDVKSNMRILLRNRSYDYSNLPSEMREAFNKALLWCMRSL